MSQVEQFNELTRAVGRIEGKLDAIVGLSARVGSLERWRAWTIGAGAALGMALGAIWHVFTAGLHGR